VKETEIHGENHRPTTSNWQTLSHKVVSSTSYLSGIRTRCTGSCISNYHGITTMTTPFLYYSFN
jgi:hypothetical protein